MFFLALCRVGCAHHAPKYLPKMPPFADCISFPTTRQSFYSILDSTINNKKESFTSSNSFAGTEVLWRPSLPFLPFLEYFCRVPAECARKKANGDVLSRPSVKRRKMLETAATAAFKKPALYLPGHVLVIQRFSSRSFASLTFDN